MRTQGFSRNLEPRGTSINELPVTVRTRFAPSPTGDLHLGGVRTALFAWLFARHHGGSFLLRVEDTDHQRSTEASTQLILEGLQWLGLDSDEPPVYQSARLDRYSAIAQEMLADGRAYHCYCTREELEEMREAQRSRGEKPRYDGRCRNRVEPRPGVVPTVRFRNPDSGSVVVEDEVRGRVVFDNAELDDLVIIRSDGFPTYNFSVVVDDSDMQISHVIRGDDHLNNTPRQINLYGSLGRSVPKFAHLPMIHGSDGGKLSKRHGALSVLEYRDQGVLPEALVNYLVRLGWSLGDEEIISKSQMIEAFDLKGVNKSPSRFDAEKLLWLNQHYIGAVGADELGRRLEPHLTALGIDWRAGPPVAEVAEALKTRGNTLREIAEKSRPYFGEFGGYEEKAARKFLTGGAVSPLNGLLEELASADTWDSAVLEGIVRDVAVALELKLGAVAQPLRVALVGSAASPGIGDTLALVGRERSLERIRRAIDHARSRS